jgi:trigger factor
VIGEIAERQKIEVTQDEMKRALIARARSFPGQERFVYEYYEKNPAALVEIKGPIFEDKVVEYILEQAKPADKKVSVEELLKAVADEDELTVAHQHDHEHHHHGHDHHDHAHDHDHHGADHSHGGDKR